MDGVHCSRITIFSVHSMNIFCNQVLWADGRKSWIKEPNLPQKIQDCLQKGETYMQKVISLEEFEQKRSEYQAEITTTGKSTYGTYQFTPAVKR